MDFWGSLFFNFQGPGVSCLSLFGSLKPSASSFRSETQFKKKRDVFVYISASGCQNPGFTKWVDNLFTFYNFSTLIVRTGRTPLSAIDLSRRDDTILNVFEASHRTC